MRMPKPLYKRSLAINEKALGPDHPDVAVSLNNLAALYMTRTLCGCGTAVQTLAGNTREGARSQSS